MSDPDVAIAVSPREWADALHRFVADHGGARVRARVLDAREALDDDYDVLVAEDLTSFLTARLVDELHRLGRGVLGVYDDSEPWGREHLRELGVDETIPRSATPEEFVVSLRALATAARLDDELSELLLGDLPPADAAPVAAGRVVGVAAPSGGVGTTEVAITLADELGLRGFRTVLVDADRDAPAVVQRLGLGLHPNVRTAIDAVRHRSADVGSVMQSSGDVGAEILAGVPSMGEAEIRVDDVIEVIDELTGVYDAVVLDLGRPSLCGPDAPTARALLGRVDGLVGVCAPTPVGVVRVLEWAAGLRTHDARLDTLLVNRVPRSLFKRGALGEELGRDLPVTRIVVAPFDVRVERAAWDGTLPGRGPFRRVLAGLTDEVVGALRATAPSEVTA